MLTINHCISSTTVRQTKCRIVWAPSSEFVLPSIPSWQILTAHAQPFRGARDLAFCLTVPLDSLPVWASSEGSGETARMRRLAWTFAARIGDKYQIRLTRSVCECETITQETVLTWLIKIEIVDQSFKDDQVWTDVCFCLYNHEHTETTFTFLYNKYIRLMLYETRKCKWVVVKLPCVHIQIRNGREFDNTKEKFKSMITRIIFSSRTLTTLKAKVTYQKGKHIWNLHFDT